MLLNHLFYGIGHSFGVKLSLFGEKWSIRRALTALWTYPPKNHGICQTLPPFFWQCLFCISHLVFCICGFSSAVVTNECCRGGNANRFNHLCASQQILNLSLHWKKYIFLIKICSEILISGFLWWRIMGYVRKGFSFVLWHLIVF